MAQPHVRSAARIRVATTVLPSQPIRSRAMFHWSERSEWKRHPCVIGSAVPSRTGRHSQSPRLPRRLPTGPRCNMLVFQVFPDQLEIGRVVGHQRCPRFPARCRQEEVVDQRLRKTPEFSSFFPCHHGDRGPSLVPGRMARRYHAPCSCQRSQQVLSNLSDFRWSACSDNQFVKDNRTEVCVRREIREIPLEFLRTLADFGTLSHRGSCPVRTFSRFDVTVEYVLHPSASRNSTHSCDQLLSQEQG